MSGVPFEIIDCSHMNAITFKTTIDTVTMGAILQRRKSVIGSIFHLQ
jgi:hypothetical protein